MTIRAVIFDLGGVLVRTEDLTPRQQLAERLGLTYEDLYNRIFDSESAIQATTGAVTFNSHWESVRSGLDMAADEFEEAFSSVQKDFFGGDSLDLALVDYIRGLRPRYKTGLLSNAWDNLRQMLEQDWQILDAFDQVVISAEVGIAKPDPRIFNIVVERLGVKPGEAVFVDDMPQNIAAARTSGLEAVHFRSREQALAELDSLLKES